MLLFPFLSTSDVTMRSLKTRTPISLCDRRIRPIVDEFGWCAGERKDFMSIEAWGAPFRSFCDCISTMGSNLTAAVEQIFGEMMKLENNIDREGLSAVCGPGVSARPAYEAIKFDFGPTKPIVVATGPSAMIAHKKAEGGHIEQANGGVSEVREITEDCIAKFLELTSKNKYYTGFKERISDDELDATRVRKLNKWQAAYEHCLIALKALIPGNTASDKQTCFSSLAGWLHCLCPELATNKLFSQAVIQLTELLSASTKFVCRIKEGVAWIFSKNVFVLVLLISNLAMVTSVDTYNSTAVVSPPSPQPLNMARQLAPPPPPPPMRATRRGFFPLGPPSPSVTESKTEWGLSPKPSPPSCLPDC